MGLSSSIVNSVGETMWNPSRVAASPSRSALAPGSERAPSAARCPVQEEPLERVAHVARREPAAVVKADARPKAEAISETVVFDGDLRRQPGHDLRSLGLAEESSKMLGRTSPCSTVSVRDTSRLRTTPAMGTCTTPPGRARRRRGGRSRRRFSHLVVVDERGGAPEHDAADGRGGDAVVHVVEERDQNAESRREFSNLR
jgi:hypothetical protein